MAAVRLLLSPLPSQLHLPSTPDQSHLNSVADYQHQLWISNQAFWAAALLLSARMLSLLAWSSVLFCVDYLDLGQLPDLISCLGKPDPVLPVTVGTYSFFAACSCKIMLLWDQSAPGSPSEPWHVVFRNILCSWAFSACFSKLNL